MNRSFQRLYCSNIHPHRWSNQTAVYNITAHVLFSPLFFDSHHARPSPIERERVDVVGGCGTSFREEVRSPHSPSPEQKKQSPLLLVLLRCRRCEEGRRRGGAPLTRAYRRRWPCRARSLYPAHQIGCVPIHMFQNFPSFSRQVLENAFERKMQFGS